MENQQNECNKKLPSAVVSLPPLHHVSMIPFGIGTGKRMIIHYNCTRQFLVALICADLPSVPIFT